MTPSATIDSQRVVLALGRLPGRVQDMARRVVREFGLDVLAQAKRNAPVKTGKLRRSLNAQFASTPGVESGVVGANVEYARQIEEGFSGSENVKAFMRMQTQAWGRPITPHLVSVKAFTRNVNRPAKPYLLPAFQTVTPLSTRLREGMAQLGLQ